MCTSNSKTDQENAEFAYKPVAKGRLHDESYRRGLDSTDARPDAKISERSPGGDHENPRKPDVEDDGHLHNESHRQSLKPTGDWSDTEARERGPDGGEESQMEPEAEDEVKCYQPAPQACPPDKAEDDDLSHNSLSCGFETHPSPSPQSPMKPPLWSTILVIPALTSYTSPCVNWLPSVPNRQESDATTTSLQQEDDQLEEKKKAAFA
uniref:Uncharacterized protein n=1 Tax=Biomphalaria glabrata TaxID=6526 RepID=A0A2C9LIZ0_BIOGL